MNVSATKLTAIIFSSILFGIGVGALLADYIFPEEDMIECEPGTYLDSSATCAVLMTVGAHALNDEVYDAYELNQMLEDSTII